MQRELTRLGYSTGGTDGVWGRNTRTAIATWQRDRKEKVTGYLTEAQLKVLARGAVVVPPEDVDPGALAPAEIEAALKLTRTQRTTIQKQLTALGYDAGVADGLWGSKTRVAIKTWQKANKKTQTGYVTALAGQADRDQAGKVAPPPPTNEAALEEQLLQLSVEERADLQVRLRHAGLRDRARRRDLHHHDAPGDRRLAGGRGRAGHGVSDGGSGQGDLGADGAVRRPVHGGHFGIIVRVQWLGRGR